MQRASATANEQAPTAPGSLPWVGARITGLNAAPTGAVDDTVARLDGVVTVQADGAGHVPVSVVTTANNGTVVSILPGSRGKYEITASVICQTAATVFAGLSFNATGATLTSDPDATNVQYLDVARRIAAGADTDTISLKATIEINEARVNDPLGTGAQIRLHLSNGAGAGAAAASLVLAQCQLNVRRVGDVG